MVMTMPVLPLGSRDLALIALGRVLDAHETRHRARCMLRLRAEEKERAEYECRALGGYADSGEFQHTERAAARAVFDAALAAKVEAEQRFKAMRLGFTETHPNLVQALDALLDQQARRHGAEKNPTTTVSGSTTTAAASQTPRGENR